jgi:hypothetical protein
VEEAGLPIGDIMRDVQFRAKINLNNAGHNHAAEANADASSSPHMLQNTVLQCSMLRAVVDQDAKLATNILMMGRHTKRSAGFVPVRVWPLVMVATVVATSKRASCSRIPVPGSARGLPAPPVYG